MKPSVNLEPCVPYGWQFADEAVSMPTARGKGVNCFGLFTRDNQSVVATSENSVTADFVVEQLERLSFSIEKITVVVLDNARIHTGRQVSERIGCWQQRGLFIFYLPTYSPHLNIAETVWRKLKYEWLAPGDYEDQQRLRYSVNQALNEFLFDCIKSFSIEIYKISRRTELFYRCSILNSLGFPVIIERL